MTDQETDPMSSRTTVYPTVAPTVFELAGFSLEVVEALTESFDQGEGSLFQNDPAEVEAQSRFLIRALRAANATRILETGTHKGHFSYFARLVRPDVQVHTFGLDEGSRIAVNLLVARFGPFVDFHLGDSKESLPRFTPPAPIDFAWIDGGHDLATCLSDLEQCDRLEVPQVCVDDARGEPAVAEAVSRFVARAGYRLVELSDDRRGIAWLRRCAARSPQGSAA